MGRNASDCADDGVYFPLLCGTVGLRVNRMDVCTGGGGEGHGRDKGE